MIEELYKWVKLASPSRHQVLLTSIDGLLHLLLSDLDLVIESGPLQNRLQLLTLGSLVVQTFAVELYGLDFGQAGSACHCCRLM